MQSESVPIESLVQHNLRPFDGTPEKLRQYWHTSVNPILRLPVLGDLSHNTISVNRFELIKDRLTDIKALSKWLIFSNAIELIQIPTNLKNDEELYDLSDEGLIQYANSISVDVFDYRAEKEKLYWESLNKPLWSRYSLYGIENNLFSISKLEALLNEEIDHNALLEIPKMVCVHLEQILQIESEKWCAEDGYFPTLTIDAEMSRDKNCLTFYNDDFYVFDLIDFLSIEDESIAHLVRQAFHLISDCLCPIELPDMMANLMMEGWSLEQEDITRLEELDLLGDLDEAFKYIINHHKDFNMETEENLLEGFMEERGIIKQDMVDWDSKLNEVSDYFVMADTIKSIDLSGDEDCLQRVWLKTVGEAFFKTFDSHKVLESVFEYKSKKVNFEGTCQLTLLSDNDIYGAQIIQPNYQYCQESSTGMEGMSVEISDGDSFAELELYLKVVGTGYGLLGNATNKNNAL